MSPYCDRDDLETYFGTANVQKWGDVDDDGSTTAISDSVSWALSVGDSEVDSLLQGTPLSLPVTSMSGTTPWIIRHCAVQLSGASLYENRGVADIDPQSGKPLHRLTSNRLYAREVLDDIRSGKRKLDAK